MEWLLAADVRNGKRSLHRATFDALSRSARLGERSLGPSRLLHPDAISSARQLAAVTRWT